MPRGDKSAYSDKQIRQAEHIEESYEEPGVSQREVEQQAGATVNKQTGGGKRSGSGRNTKDKAKKSASRSSTTRASSTKQTTWTRGR